MRYGQIRIIAGKWRSRKLAVPARTRPPQNVLRETLFNVLQPQLARARCLDLYAGSGSLGLEALSRNAQSVVFVEKSKQAASILATNIRALGAEESTQIVQQPTHSYLTRNTAKQFELIFADPPYADAASDRWWDDLLDATRPLLGLGALLCCESPQAIVAPLNWAIVRTCQRGSAHWTILKKESASA